jgi:hypothetical protein
VECKHIGSKKEEKGAKTTHTTVHLCELVKSGRATERDKDDAVVSEALRC